MCIIITLQHEHEINMHLLSKQDKFEINDLMPSISMESLFYLPDWHVYQLDSKGK